MITVYAIKSLRENYIYVGLTSSLKNRINRHNSRYERTTKPYAPFEDIYTKDYVCRKEARVHEKYLKSGVGKEFLKSLL